MKPSPIVTAILNITDTLVAELSPLKFKAPITHTYNPLEYARKSWDLYIQKYAHIKPKVIFLGMNPGPYGMAQTGIPFGEIAAVRDWMGIQTEIGQPDRPHPKRPIEGFACKKSEVSGRRLWGWAKDQFHTPENFFKDHFVLNYCPLVFMEASGKNFTPDKLPVKERALVFQACDQALRDTVSVLNPKWVIGVGGFAVERAKEALGPTQIQIGQILHPSPANPQANRGWAQAAQKQLQALGISAQA